MTGRGRPRKTKSPAAAAAAAAECDRRGVKEASQPRCPDFTEEKQKPKKREQKNCAEEKTANQLTDGRNKQQCTPKECTKAKPARASSAEQRAMKTQTEAPKASPELNDTIKDFVKTAKAKACGGKAKLREKFAEEPKMQPEEYLQKLKTEEITQDKVCAGKAKSVEKCRKLTEMPTMKSEDLTKDRTKDKAAIDYVLKATLENLKIKKKDISNAAEVINNIKKNIIKHLKDNTKTFKEVEEPLNTGSYYENVKISNPDEFDVMLAFPVKRVDIKPFGSDGAFYSVSLKRDSNPLKKFQENDVLSASEMLKEFREEVKKCVKEFTEWKVEKKKPGCPAVTLTTTVETLPISLDVVLCLMVKSSWPPFTKEGLKIEGWLGTKVKRDYKLKPYYLVPKYEGRGNVENDGVLARDSWRISFSHVEKAILKNHGSEKTCCESQGDSCCRKSCLKLLKHLLHLLKENNSSFVKFCSYHAKTTLLHTCCSRTKDSEWKDSDLSRCFQLLLEDFERYLEKGELQNFFIPSQNLLSGLNKNTCKTLSSAIREERQKGFPIFREQLKNAH